MLMENIMMSSSNCRYSLINAFPKTLDNKFAGKTKELLNICYIDKIEYNNQVCDSVIFVNDHIFKITTEFDKNFIENVKNILKKYKKQLVIIFNLDIENLMNIIKYDIDIEYGFLYHYECQINKFVLKSNLIRKYNKASKYFRLKIDNLSIEDYQLGINMYDLMKYANDEFKNIDVKRIVKFYLNNNHAINLFCYCDDVLVGMMLGFVYENYSYMHIFYYNSDYSKYYISDYLYQSFFHESKKRGIERVVWGDVNINNIGLNNFKSHYSTEMKKSYFCIYNRASELL